MMKLLLSSLSLFILLISDKLSVSWGYDTETSSTYIGCFKDKVDSRKTYKLQRQYETATPEQGRALTGYFTYTSGMTIQSCLEMCKSKNFKYAGLQNSNACHCGNSGYDRHGENDKPCSMKCVGFAEEICGDSWANSVYEIIKYRSTYIGCFKDKVDDIGNNSTDTENVTATLLSGRALSGYGNYSSDMTTEKCQDLCHEKGFKFAGLQNSSACYCGNSGFDKYGRNENSCTMKCSGNENQICGDQSSNSIYELLEVFKKE